MMAWVVAIPYALVLFVRDLGSTLFAHQQSGLFAENVCKQREAIGTARAKCKQTKAPMPPVPFEHKQPTLLVAASFGFAFGRSLRW